MLTLRSYLVDLRMFAWNILQTCLGVPAIGSFRKKMKKKWKKNEKKSYGNAWPLLTFLEACGRWGRGDTFSPLYSASPRSWTKRLAMSPSSTVHMTWQSLWYYRYSTVNLWHSSVYCMRHLWRTHFFGAMSLNQLVYMSQRNTSAKCEARIVIYGNAR